MDERCGIERYPGLSGCTQPMIVLYLKLLGKTFSSSLSKFALLSL